jgi:hypothetical protein
MRSSFDVREYDKANVKGLELLNDLAFDSSER